MSQNNGFLAQSTQLALNKGFFACAQSLTNAAEQFVPPYNGSTTSLTVNTWGIICRSTTSTIESFVFSFLGDAANVGGQTIVGKLYYLRGGSLTLLGTSSALATTAGVKSTTVTLTATFTPQDGDVLVASITPSALLTAQVQTVAFGVG